MKLRRKQFQFGILIIILSLSVYGCASPYLFIKRNPTVRLRSNEGLALFSCKFNDKDHPEKKNIFWVTAITLQEVNQYKSYGQKRSFFIPFPKANYIQQFDLFLFSLKLPRGTYKIMFLNGMFRTLFAEEYFVSANKIFDVIPGQVSYGGRLGIDFFISGGREIYETRIEDKFDEDQVRFKNDYPALQNRTIVKDLIY